MAEEKKRNEMNEMRRRDGESANPILAELAVGRGSQLTEVEVGYAVRPRTYVRRAP